MQAEGGSWVEAPLGVPDCGFARIGAIVGKADPAHPCRLVFAADAGDKGVPPRRFGCVEHGYRAGARGDHGAIGEANSLPFYQMAGKRLVVEAVVDKSQGLTQTRPPFGTALLRISFRKS
jgi:hypothetical protein